MDVSILPAADISWNSYKITSLADPTVAQDAATKKYVDDTIAIPTGTYYWSCPGTKFQAWYPYSQEVNIDGDNGVIYIEANGISVVCSIELPHGAVVTGVIVYGSATDESWYLYRIDPADVGTTSTMATANIGTEDTSITNATIDNQNYSYSLQTSTLDIDDMVYGVRITYTL